MIGTSIEWIVGGSNAPVGIAPTLKVKQTSHYEDVVERFVRAVPE
jgi:hypothetical protein